MAKKAAKGGKKKAAKKRKFFGFEPSGCSSSTPFFYSRVSPLSRKLLLARCASCARVSPRSEVAATPGRRARRQSALAAGRPRNPPVKGGILKWRRRRRAERRRR